MKKKFKLFASLASLCVAVALLVFGVYAASKVTYTLNNTVTYTFENAFVKVTRVVEKSTAATAAPVASAAAADQVYEESDIANLQFQTYNANVTAWVNPSAEGLTYTEGTKTASETVNFDLNDAYVYRVTITITTPATNGVDLTVTIPQSTLDNVYRVTGQNAYATKTTLAKTGTATIVYYVGLEDATQSVGTAQSVGDGVTIVVDQK